MMRFLGPVAQWISLLVLGLRQRDAEIADEIRFHIVFDEVHRLRAKVADLERKVIEVADTSSGAVAAAPGVTEGPPASPGAGRAPPTERWRRCNACAGDVEVTEGPIVPSHPNGSGAPCSAGGLRWGDLETYESYSEACAARDRRASTSKA